MCEATLDYWLLNCASHLNLWQALHHGHALWILLAGTPFLSLSLSSSLSLVLALCPADAHARTNRAGPIQLSITIHFYFCSHLMPALVCNARRMAHRVRGMHLTHIIFEKKKYMHLYKGHICRYTVNIRFRLSYVCLCTPVLIYDAAINIEKIRCVCGRNDADPTPSIVFVCGWFDNIFHSNAVVAIAAVTNLGTTRFPLPIIIIRRWSIVWVEAFWLNSMLLPLLCLFLWTVCLFVCLLMFPILFLCFFFVGVLAACCYKNISQYLRFAILLDRTEFWIIFTSRLLQFPFLNNSHKIWRLCSF